MQERLSGTELDDRRRWPARSHRRRAPARPRGRTGHAPLHPPQLRLTPCRLPLPRRYPRRRQHPAPSSSPATCGPRGPSPQSSLAALPQQTISIQYARGKGTEQKTETGALLSDLLPPDALATTDRKNDLLSFAVLAIGADGYSALVAYGEASPDFGNRGLLLAVAEDGQPLERPRLVVPGDVKGGRYVSDVVELRVIRAAT